MTSLNILIVTILYLSSQGVRNVGTKVVIRIGEWGSWPTKPFSFDDEVSDNLAMLKWSGNNINLTFNDLDESAPNIFETNTSISVLNVLCEADCPVQWIFHPASAKSIGDTRFAFEVLPKRTAPNVFLNSTFEYLANLTIRSKFREMTGLYECQCVQNTSRHNSVYIFWTGTRGIGFVNPSRYMEISRKRQTQTNDSWIGLRCGASSSTFKTRLFKVDWGQTGRERYMETRTNDSITTDLLHGYKIKVDSLPSPYGDWLCVQANTSYDSISKTLELVAGEYVHLHLTRGSDMLASINTEKPFSEIPRATSCLSPTGSLLSKTRYAIGTMANVNQSSCCLCGIQDDLKTPARFIPDTSSYYFENEISSKFAVEFMTVPKDSNNVVLRQCKNQAVRKQKARDYRIVICRGQLSFVVFEEYFLTLSLQFRSFSAPLDSPTEELIRIEIEPTVDGNDVIFEGESTRLKCMALSSVFADGLQWILEWKNGTQTQGKEYGSGLESAGTHQPKLFTSKLQDSADLNLLSVRCYAPDWKTDDWVKSKYYNLTVSPCRRPVILEKDNITVLGFNLGQGSEIRLQCHFYAMASNVITWVFQSENDGQLQVLNNRNTPRWLNWTRSSDTFIIPQFNLSVVGNYTCSIRNVKGSAEHIFKIKHKEYQQPVIAETKKQSGVTSEHFTVGNVNKTLPCTVNGYPFPQVWWTKNDEVIKEPFNYVGSPDLIIDEISQSTQGTYTCYARNAYGNASKSYDVTVSKPIFIPVMSTLAVLATIFFCGGFLLALLRRHSKRSADELERIRNEFICGYILDGDGSGMNPDALPQLSEFEIPKTDFATGVKLGNGTFGVVHRGLLYSGNVKRRNLFGCSCLNGSPHSSHLESRPVAIKSVLSEEQQSGSLEEPLGQNSKYKYEAAEMHQCMKSIIYEAYALVHITKCGKHPNVVEFIGVCTQRVLSMEAYIIMELCHDNLRKYLLANGTSIVNSSQNSENCITGAQLNQWCKEIAQGMLFLNSNCKVLHIDLAARNVLITESRVAKIADFGLARRLYENPDYKKKHPDFVPAAWSAIEVLQGALFSPKSDVWAYGVTMWEIYSLGKSPDYGCAPGKILLELMRGKRLDKPEHACAKTYAQMLFCWNHNARLRPDFSALLNYFEESYAEEPLFTQPMIAAVANNTNPCVLPDRSLTVEDNKVFIQPSDARQLHYHSIFKPLIFEDAFDNFQNHQNLHYNVDLESTSLGVQLEFAVNANDNGAFELMEVGDDKSTSNQDEGQKEIIAPKGNTHYHSVAAAGCTH